MLIIYYTDSTGKIVHHHGNINEMTLAKLEKAAEEFNQRGSGRTAHIVDAEEDSLTAYLFQKAAERAEWNAEELQNAVNNIEDALDAVRELFKKKRL